MVTASSLARATLSLVALLGLPLACGSSVETEQLAEGGPSIVHVIRKPIASPPRHADAGVGRDATFTGPFLDATARPFDTGTVSPFDAGDTGTARRDTGVSPYDTGVPHRDAGVGHVDTGVSPPDAGFDALHDSGHITTVDAGVDSGHDAGVDSGHDAGVDSGMDSGFDAGVDSGMDTGVVDSGVDSGPPDSAWVIAPHYPMPQILDFGGNPSVDPTGVMPSPVFIAVTFLDYDLTAEAESFVATVGATEYWTDVVSEYGVGPATAGTPIELDESAPGTGMDGGTIDDSQIQTWLAGNFDGSSANAAWGTPTPNTVYFLCYPANVGITLDGLSSCVEGGFGGYHNSVLLTSGPFAGQNVSYAVLPECSIEASTAQSLTMSGSHELIEATTDPLPQTNFPTYIQVDQNDIAWELVVGGGEVADMCAQTADAFFQPAGYAYSVQRAWSNEAAAAGHDPCQPSPLGQFFINATASLNASVVLTYKTQQIQTEGLTIPLNTPQTVDIQLYSDGPVPDWNIYPSDLSENGSGTYLDFSWQMSSGNNGTVLQLTITPVAVNPMYGGEPFALFSQDAAMTQTNFWIGFIAN